MITETELLDASGTIAHLAARCPDARRRAIIATGAATLAAWAEEVREQRVKRGNVRIALEMDTIGGALDDRLHSVRVPGR